MHPIIVEQVFNASPGRVWNALTSAEEMKAWYFDVNNFKLETGNEFSFYESGGSCNYLHICRITGIIPEQLLEHSWAYPNHSKGLSKVRWELKAYGKKTRVRITHEGTENFADGGPDFSPANFKAGWEAIVSTQLRNYLYNIQRLEFRIDINASAEKVWTLLWDKDSYTDWTRPFCEGSYYTGELKQGGRVHFLIPSGYGMYSDVVLLKEKEALIFKHIGELAEFKEMPLDEAAMLWTNAYETYRLTKINGGTLLRVEVDSVPDMVGHMQEKFPLALDRLKEKAEAV